MRPPFGSPGVYDPPYQVKILPRKYFPERGLCLCQHIDTLSYLIYFGNDYPGHSGASSTDIFVGHPTYAGHCMWVSPLLIVECIDLTRDSEESFYRELMDET